MATMVKAGRYEISGELGRGAMGVVYRALDPVIGRPVAVKTIRLSEEGTGLTRPELLARFQTEARAAGLLTHPNIVVVYDAGEENGLYYITMELVEGSSVQALLDGGHAFPVPRLLRIMEQTCSALQFAHEHKVVHRDIKPANIILTADDTVKVTDFGTAKILQFGTVQQTMQVMGTPSYMSPEQVKGRQVDGRSDIFSLGVMFYELLTGEKPFPGQSVTTVIYKIVNEDPIPPRQLNTSIHPGLNDIVMRALAKEPEVRYQSCREMLEDLRNYRTLGMNGGNPEATLISARPSATLPIGTMGPSNAGLRGLHGNLIGDDPVASPTLRALENRTGSPGQTPTLRRTGPVVPYQEPKKKNLATTIFSAVALMAVIGYGGYKLRPELQMVREHNNSQASENAPASSPAPARPQGQLEPGPADSNLPLPAAPALSRELASSPAANVGAIPSTDGAADKAPAVAPAIARKDPEPAPSASLPKKESPDGLTPVAAEYKRKVGEVLAQRGLASSVKVLGTGNTITISGRMTASDYASFFHYLPSAPPSVHMVDDIHYEPVGAAASAGNETAAREVPARGYGALHIVTDVSGATATLYGTAGSSVSSCRTPCTLNDLVPAQYSLQIQKDGYRPVQTALELKTGDSPEQRFHLESLSKGLLVTTQPSGADVFINGAKQSGQTPMTIPLAAGQFDMVIRLNGYAPYVGQVQVKDNVLTTMDVELKTHAPGHVAWLQVNTTPRGAEIIVDGNSTSQFSPARVEIPAGPHTVLMKLPGFQLAKRTIDATEGGTVTVTEPLAPK